MFFSYFPALRKHIPGRRLYAGLVTVRAFSFVPPAAASILIFMDVQNAMNLIHAVITGLIALGVSFAAGMILGFDEPEAENAEI